MSSGVGVFSKNGRCAPFWAEFLKCKNNTSEPLMDCRDQLEDYVECLHHRKEREKMIQIIKELERKQAEEQAKNK